MKIILLKTVFQNRLGFNNDIQNERNSCSKLNYRSTIYNDLFGDPLNPGREIFLLAKLLTALAFGNYENSTNRRLYGKH